MTNKLIIAGVIVAISLGVASLFIQGTGTEIELVSPAEQILNPCKSTYDEMQKATKAKDREGMEKSMRAFYELDCAQKDIYEWNINPLNPCLSYWEILWQDTDGQNNLELHTARSQMIVEGCFDRIDQWMPPERTHENNMAHQVWAQVWDQWNEESRERYTRGDMGSVDSAKETPTIQEYEIFLDPVITKDDEDYLFKYARVTIQNTGTKPLTNVKVNYGSGDIEELGTLKPGQIIHLTPPWDNLKEYVVITADEEIFMNKTYRIPSEISGMNEP